LVVLTKIIIQVGWLVDIFPRCNGIIDFLHPCRREMYS
jgi:hypothetical protein